MIERFAKIRFRPVREKHWNWKGGITEATARLRQTPEYHEWRRKVYARDRWTCQNCGDKTRNLVAHHLKSFRDFPEFRFEVSNGITLCRPCHKQIHSEIGIDTQFKVVA